MIYFGATADLGFIWLLADTLNAMMAIPNLIALALLSPIVFKLTREFFASGGTDRRSRAQPLNNLGQGAITAPCFPRRKVTLRGDKKMATKILLPIDHTDENSWKSALPAGDGSGPKFYRAELHVVSVIPEIIQCCRTCRRITALAPRIMSAVRYRSILDHNGACRSSEIHIEEGSVYREVLKLAHKEGFDMIVMASSKGDFPNYEIGPNLARVVRNAHCTVMVIRG